MKNKTLAGLVAVVAVVAVAVYAADFKRPANPSHQIGFGAQSSSTAVGSIAISSCDGAAAVDAVEACQIGTGLNDQAGSLKYRSTYILDAGGGFGIQAYGLMALKYARYEEDWFESGGYKAATGFAGTNFAKFSEQANQGTWLVTVVDGGGDNAETIRIMTGERNGMLAMVPNNAANDSINAEMQGESFRIRSGYMSAFNTRFLSTDTNVTARVGLHMTGTTEGINTPGTDYIGFRMTNSGTASLTNAVYFEMGKNSTNTSVYCGSIADGSFAAMGFGTLAPLHTRLVVTFNGAVIATYTIGNVLVPVPDDEALSPLIANRSISTGQGYLKLDYVGTIQER